MSCIQIERQSERNQFDPDALVRAEAFIAGYRFARGEEKLNFQAKEMKHTAAREGLVLSSLEQMIAEICEMANK